MRHVFDYIKRHRALLWVIIPGFLLHMLVIMPSGSNICINNHCGYFFWSANDNDAIWHLEIVAVAFKQFPFIIPTYAGGQLSGYNILMDLGIFLISRLGIPPMWLYFKIIPVIWFFFYTSALIILGRKIKDSPLFVGLLLFCVYFSGHFGYVLTLYHSGKLINGGQSFAIQGATSLLNLQFSLTLPILLYILILIKEKDRNLRKTILLIFLSCINLAFKFYAGSISLFLVGLYILESSYQKKSWTEFFKQVIIFGVFTAVTVLIFYNPFQSTPMQPGSVLQFSPFSTIHSIIEAPDMVYMKNLVLARYTLIGLGKFSPRLLAIELFSTALYVFFNFGTKVFGLIYVLYKLSRRKAERLEIYVFSASILMIIFTALLVQRGEWWNTVQFMYYAIFLSNIFLAELLYDLWKAKNNMLLVLAGLIIILSLPMNLDTIYGFTYPIDEHISREEIQAMKFLKKQPDGVVFNAFKRNYNIPYYFFDYMHTGFVSAFSNKQLYFSHQSSLFVIGLDYYAREKRILKYDCTVFNEVQYIYYNHAMKTDYLRHCKSTVSKNFKQIFENKEVTIYGKR